MYFDCSRCSVRWPSGGICNSASVLCGSQQIDMHYSTPVTNALTSAAQACKRQVDSNEADGTDVEAMHAEMAARQQALAALRGDVQHA